MPMGVSSGYRFGMRMRMMVIMHMLVVVFHDLVGMKMVMLLCEMQPYTNCHKYRCNHKLNR